MNSLISFKNNNCFLELSSKTWTIPIVISFSDWKGVTRAANDLATDFGQVTGKDSEVLHSMENLSDGGSTPTAILIGTLGKSPFIDALVSSKKIEISSTLTKSEAYLIQVIDNPLPGLDRALVIVGSDKRGSIYGIYEISAQIGVSPWYWWADAPVRKNTDLWANSTCLLSDSPKIKYRGIFLNDEFPSLTNWVKNKYGEVVISSEPPVPPNIANYGHEFYSHIFELLLRLKANYLWPAMWDNAFNEDDKENVILADEYGIIMGTSHQEPMLRAQMEWDRRYESSLGKWNYTEHQETLENFWREGIERYKNFESIINVGLRGADDTEMSGDGNLKNMKLLEKIVERQRKIIAQTMGNNIKQTSQMWCLYKEVQEYYEEGMRVPDDITLLWSDDNWGNLRRLPTANERKRSGGSGIYYHFDYHGAPRSYQWINTTPIAKIWDQMLNAYEYGADRVWIVNVGHLKGYEYPISFFMDFAWCPNNYTSNSLKDYSRSWAANIFGNNLSHEASDIIETCVSYNARCKPELLSPNTWNLLNYNEAERIIKEWNLLEKRATQLYESSPDEVKDTIYQLILFPVRASALVNDLYISAGKNALWASQGRMATNEQKQRVISLFKDFQLLVANYNTDFAGGKWAHFMDQSVLGYTGWKDPPYNTIDHIPLHSVTESTNNLMGVSLEGSSASWPNKKEPSAHLSYYQLGKNAKYIEIYNKGISSFTFSITSSDPWINVEKASGTLNSQARIYVSIDWDLVPPKTKCGNIMIKGAGTSVPVTIDLYESETMEKPNSGVFVETDLYLAIEAEHFSENIASSLRHWELIEGFGKTLSGMKAKTEANPPVLTPKLNSPCLEYRMWFNHTGKASVILYISPVLNCIPGEKVQIGVSLDEESVEYLTVIEANYRVTNDNEDWGLCVSESGRKLQSDILISRPGEHRVKVWMISPGIVLERVMVDLGGLRPSYLGPCESFKTP